MLLCGRECRLGAKTVGLSLVYRTAQTLAHEVGSLGNSRARAGKHSLARRICAYLGEQALRPVVTVKPCCRGLTGRYIGKSYAVAIRRGIYRAYVVVFLFIKQG